MLWQDKISVVFVMHVYPEKSVTYGQTDRGRQRDSKRDIKIAVAPTYKARNTEIVKYYWMRNQSQ